MVKIFCGTNVTVTAVYSPPRQGLTSSDYIYFINHLGLRWVIGGVFNIKHAYWPKLNSPKGTELYSAIKQTHSSAVSGGRPTVFALRPRQDIRLHWFLHYMWNCSSIHWHRKCDSTSGHSPIVLTWINQIIRKHVNASITNKNIDWDLLHKLVIKKINFHTRL